MQSVGEGIYGIIVLSLASDMMLQVFPSNRKILPYLRFLLSLVLLLVLLSPLYSVLSQADVLFGQSVGGIADPAAAEGGSVYAQAVTEAALAEAENSLAYLISAKTGIGREDMEISFTTQTEDDTVTVISTAVTVPRRYRIAGDKISALVEETLLCPCTVRFAAEEAEQ